jgi:hypothetical protein
MAKTFGHIKYWYYKINGRKLRIEARHQGPKTPAVKIGDKAWQIGHVIVVENDGKLELL